MNTNTPVIQLNLEDYAQPGLYLTIGEKTRLAITRENTERITREFWQDPRKIPPEAKKAIGFQRCDFCPLKGKNDLCDALRPILPLLSVVDDYNSFDNVTAIYKGVADGLYHISDTTLQQALRYVSNLSLMSYCRIGRQYRKYYAGIIPVLKIEEIVNRLYLNIYWYHGGDLTVVDTVISEFHEYISATTRNQLDRLRLISKNDAFLNAFVLTHLVTDILNEDRDRKLKQQMAENNWAP